MTKLIPMNMNTQHLWANNQNPMKFLIPFACFSRISEQCKAPYKNLMAPQVGLIPATISVLWVIFLKPILMVV